MGGTTISFHHWEHEATAMPDLGLNKSRSVLLVDGKEVGNTLQCNHCNAHFFMFRGSGTVRGYCMKCNSVICNRKRCTTDCIPFEKRLELVAKGLMLPEEA